MNEEQDKAPAGDMPDTPDADPADPKEGAPGAAEAVTDSDALLQELESLRREVEAGQDRALRAQAELDNLRKRTARDVENAHKFALERFIQELLPVIDSLELGIAAADTSGDAAGLREGMELTLKKFRDTLEKFGVTALDPAGARFNPEQHEAVSMQAGEGAEAGTVLSVMQKGYELNGRLVRPAMVVVAR